MTSSVRSFLTERLQGSPLGERLLAMSPARRMAAGSAMALLLVGLGASVFWGTQPEYVVLTSDRNYAEIAEIAETLEMDGIAARVTRQGTELMVRDMDYPDAQLSLARSGQSTTYATEDGLEIFGTANWGMTDFSEQVNFRRALEGALTNTLTRMEWIQSARVHIQIPERSPFQRSQDPSTAVVTVDLAPGAPSGHEAVQSIRLVVASAAPRLDPEAVRVVDTRGRVLSPPDADSREGVQEYRTMVRREIERETKQRVLSLLGSLYDENDVRVEVSALLNFDSFSRREHAYDPERQTILSEQEQESLPAFDGLDVGGGSSSVTRNYQNSVALESFERAQGQVERLSVAVLINDRAFRVELDDGEDEVAAVQGLDPTNDEDHAQLEDLVQAAMGFDGDRGDQVVVQSGPFFFEETAPIEPDTWSDWIYENPRSAVAIGGILGSILGLLLLLFALRPKRMEREEDTEAPDSPPEDSDEKVPEKTLSPAEQTHLTRLSSAQTKANEDPSNTARLIASWINEADEVSR